MMKRKQIESDHASAHGSGPVLGGQVIRCRALILAHVVRAAAALLLVATLSGTSLPSQGKPHYPKTPNLRFYLECRYPGEGGKESVIEVPVKLPSPLIPWRPNQVIDLPAPLPRIHIEQYLPRAVLVQAVESDPTGKAPPCLELSVDGPELHYRRWLAAGDPARNQMQSLIANWRYAAVEGPDERDKLLRRFRTEFTRDPVLMVSRPDGSDAVEIPVPGKPGNRELKRLGCKVEVKAFYPHFTANGPSGKPANLSERRENPAALIRVEWSEGHGEGWVFARFPEFDRRKQAAWPVSVRLDCPPERPVGGARPDFFVVTVGGAEHVVFSRHGDKAVSTRLVQGKAVAVPESRYSFQFARFISSGQLVERYELTRAKEAKEAVAVLRLEIADGRKGSTESGIPYTLVLGKRRTVRAGRAVLELLFGARRP